MTKHSFFRSFQKIFGWNTLTVLSFAFLSLALTASSTSYAKNKKRTTAQLLKHFDKDINKILKIKNYKSRWRKLVQYDPLFERLKPRQKVKLLQQQAKVLEKDGFPTVSAIYHAQAIMVDKNPKAKIYKRSWKALYRLSKNNSLENVMLIVAKGIPSASSVPYFKKEWRYYQGILADRNGDMNSAYKHFNAVPKSSRFFASARLQMGLMQIARGKSKTGEKMFDETLSYLKKPRKNLSEDQREQLIELSYLSKARHAYQSEKFDRAIKNYRKIDKNSRYYFDALFEHSWALFMGGYPNHALGAVHSAESPFFKDIYSPEVPVLRAMVYYWLCDYDQSRNALAHFIEKYQDSVNGLESYLGKKAISSDEAYKLFEDLISGVSQESLGIPKALLETAANKDTMRLVRENLASVVEERNKLKAKGIFGTKKGSGKVLAFLDRLQNIARRNLGIVFRGELLALKEDYERLNAQAKFLYVELLMSEKEQILGQELHADSKLSDKATKRRVKKWASNNRQTWSKSDKGEYWWDEVGYHIYNEKSKCNTKEQIMEAEL